jgi:predicted dinucleotide-binding enzyme
MNLGDFIITCFCLIGEMIPMITKDQPLRARGPVPKLSESEVITMEVVGNYLGLNQDSALFASFQRHYTSFFPALAGMSRTTFVRQAANLWAVKERVWCWLRDGVITSDPTISIIDSAPLPICRFARAPWCVRFRGVASYGKDHADRQTFYGLCLPYDHIEVLIGSSAEALAEKDVVLLAVPGSAVEEVIATHAQLLDHKIIIDATNQLVKGQTVATQTWQGKGALNSLSTIQAHVPHAQVFRAFNSYAWEAFADPIYQGVQADLFHCGPNGDELAVVEQLITEIGLRPVRLGGLDKIGVVDEVLQLWGTLALFQGWGRDNVAFKVLTR